jgi:hypothetical protein
MPIGSFTAAQSTGIMICTGVTAVFMRFITPMQPADLSDEDLRREKETEKIAANPDKESSSASESDSQKNELKNAGTSESKSAEKN